MKSRTHCLLAVFAICLAFSQARGQEGQPGYRPPGAPGATGPENKYVELSHSKDRVLKATAERYLNLIKFQEWGGASGKTQIAKYVSHDPDLKRVKLSVAKGTGKDRVLKEFDVEVEKLSKTSQARVKQIDVLQKRLDELAATDAAKGDGTGRPGGPEGPGAPGRVRGPEATSPGPEVTATGPGEVAPHPGVPAQAGPEVDASASEPDPLGFAELPPITPTVPTGLGGSPTSPTAPGSPPAPGDETSRDSRREQPGPSAKSRADNSNQPKSLDELKAAFVTAFNSGDKAALEKLIYWGNSSDQAKLITRSYLIDNAGREKVVKVGIQNAKDGLYRREYKWTFQSKQVFNFEIGGDGHATSDFVWPFGEVEGKYYLGAWNPEESSPAPSK